MSRKSNAAAVIGRYPRLTREDRAPATDRSRRMRIARTFSLGLYTGNPYSRGMHSVIEMPNFLADAKELVYQAADKLGKWAGVVADVEMADNHAMPGSRLVVATTQSIARRLDKYPRDAFGLVIVDEAHRNTMGAQAQSVLEYFSSAKVIGITATPFRSDKKELGSFYERIASEIGLVRLIKEGFLSRITIERSDDPVMSRARKRLFIAIAHNAASPITYFRLPQSRTVSLGSTVYL